MDYRLGVAPHRTECARLFEHRCILHNQTLALVLKASGVEGTRPLQRAKHRLGSELIRERALCEKAERGNGRSGWSVRASISLTASAAISTASPDGRLDARAVSRGPIAIP